MRIVITLFLILSINISKAQTSYSPMSWGINKGVTPYAFGANINGTWRNLGTVNSAGLWTIDSQFSTNSLKYISQNTDKIFNVKNYGATCNGSRTTPATSSDSAGINAALAEADVYGGGIVFIPGYCRYEANTALTIPSQGIAIEGTGSGSSGILFDNGANDGIVYNATSGNRFEQMAIRNILLDYKTTKTGGRAIYAPYVNTSSMEDVFILNAWNGVELYIVNNWDVRNVWMQNIRGGTGKYCMYWHAPATGAAAESQFLKLTQWGCNANLDVAGNGIADGLVIDGFSQSLIGGHIEIAGTRYGVWIKNSANSTQYYPSFLNFGSLYTTISSSQAVRIEGGRWMEFPSFHIENNTGYAGQGSADTYGLYIAPDSSYSVTQNISFGIGTIGHSKDSAAYVNAKDISFTGTKFAASANTAAGKDAVTLGSSAANVIFSGTQVGVTINDSTPTNWRYGLFIGTSNAVYLGNGDWVTGASPGGVFGSYFTSIQTATTAFATQIDYNRGGTHTYIGPSAGGTLDIFSNENIPILFGTNGVDVLKLSTPCNGYLKGAGSTAATCSNTTIDLGTAASAAGTISLANGGVGGDVVTIQNPSATAGNYNFNLPATAGTAGNVLLSGGGGTNPMTWQTGATATVTVRNSAGTGTCTLSFTSGVFTGTTC